MSTIYIARCKCGHSDRRWLGEVSAQLMEQNPEPKCDACGYRAQWVRYEMTETVVWRIGFPDGSHGFERSWKGSEPLVGAAKRVRVVKRSLKRAR